MLSKHSAVGSTLRCGYRRPTGSATGRRAIGLGVNSDSTPLQIEFALFTFGTTRIFWLSPTIGQANKSGSDRVRVQDTVATTFCHDPILLNERSAHDYRNADGN